MSTNPLDNLAAAVRYARRTYTDPRGHTRVDRHKVAGVPFGWGWRVIDWNGHTVAHGWTLLRSDARTQASAAHAAHIATLDAETLAAARRWETIRDGLRAHGYRSGTQRLSATMNPPGTTPPNGPGQP